MCVGRGGGIMHLRKETKANNYMIRKKEESFDLCCEDRMNGHNVLSESVQEGARFVICGR